MRKFMVIERFIPGKVEEIYQRLEERGRMLPEGLRYLGSWVNRSEHICFQLMECSDQNQFRLWTEEWEDLMTFEILSLDSEKEKPASGTE